MAITYFGYTDADTGDGDAGTGWIDHVVWHNPSVFTYACPDTGNQLVKELLVCIDPNWASASAVKVAIYDSGGNLVCSATKSVAFSGTVQWVGAVNETETSPASTLLTGGTTYILAAMMGEASYKPRTKATAGTVNSYNASSTYASGPPASLPGSPTNREFKFAIKCGVEPSAAAGQPTTKRHGGVLHTVGASPLGSRRW